MTQLSIEYKWDFFIAHASSDKHIAEALYCRLNGNSAVFLDSRSLQLGDDWDLKLRAAQQRSLITAVLISVNTDRAYYQREEIAAAIDLARSGNGHRVVPVYLNSAAACSQAVPYGLKLKHGITLSDSVGLGELEEALLKLRDELQTADKDRVVALCSSPACPSQEAPTDEFATSIQTHMATLNRQVEKLTQEQYRAIRQLQALKRVRISGCAGSGKTLVAMEKAIRLSNAGLKTLFLCHSPLLASHIASMTMSSGVRVETVGNWIASLARVPNWQAGTNWSNYEEPGTELLEQAFDFVSANGPYYDAIIVDEGQDWRGEWWTVVEASLKDPKVGILYIFHDDHQALLPYRSCYPPDLPIIDLSRNCRNAGKVYEVMQCVHTSVPSPEEELKELGDVLLLAYEHEKEVTTVNKAVQWIHQWAGMRSSFVVLLGGTSIFEKSPFSGRAIAAFKHLDWQQEVRRKFEWAIRVCGCGVMVPPSGKEEVNQRLDGLSLAPLPTPEDVELVRKVARSFRVHEDVRRKIKNDPLRRQGMKWTVRDGHLNLWRASQEPLWASEIIVHFQGKHWDNEIPVPQTVCFRKHNETSIGDAVPVYHISEFKGLEADCVLLFMEGPTMIPEHELYVGISRARLLLAMLVESQTAALLPPAFRKFRR